MCKSSVNESIPKIASLRVIALRHAFLRMATTAGRVRQLGNKRLRFAWRTSHYIDVPVGRTRAVGKTLDTVFTWVEQIIHSSIFLPKEYEKDGTGRLTASDTKKNPTARTRLSAHADIRLRQQRANTVRNRFHSSFSNRFIVEVYRQIMRKMMIVALRLGGASI